MAVRIGQFQHDSYLGMTHYFPPLLSTKIEPLLGVPHLVSPLLLLITIQLQDGARSYIFVYLIRLEN